MMICFWFDTSAWEWLPRVGGHKACGVRLFDIRWLCLGFQVERKWICFEEG
jgi:hypothetical protein